MNALKRAFIQALSDPVKQAGASGVYDKLAPQGATYPIVIMQQMSLVDSYTHDGRLAPNSVYLFKAVDENAATNPSSARADLILQAIDATFSKIRDTIPGIDVRIQVMTRIGEVDYCEVVKDRIYQHRGVRYAVSATLENVTV